jgi:hypothetical protein
MTLRLVLLVVLPLLASATLAGEGGSLLPAIQKAKAGTQCVAPPEVMRRQHPALLKHQRDETVRGGVRSAKASLKGCVECHAGPTTRSVAAAPGDFCVSCHSYAAVRIDCFECHATRPAGASPHQP